MSFRCPKRATAGSLLGATVAGALLVAGLRGASQRPQSLAGTLQAWNASAPWPVNSSDPVQVSDTLVQWGTCTVDVYQALFYLAQAGVFIKFATLDCPNRTKHEDELACAADISVAINSFFWTASYVAATINSCQFVQSIDAACVASLNGVIAELGEFAYVGVSVVEVCEFDDEEKSDYWHYKEYYDKKHGIGKKDDYEKHYDRNHDDGKRYDKKEFDAKHRDEKYQPKPYSAPPAKAAPRLPSPAEAAKFIAESAAAKVGVLDWTKPAALGHLDKQEGHDGRKEPKAPEHQNGQGKAVEWMKLAALGQQRKQKQRADLTKAWEGMKHLKDGVVDGMKVAAWLEHMKEEQEETKEKHAIQQKKPGRTNGGKKEDGYNVGDIDFSFQRGARITQCIIDVNLGLSFLARAGLQIYSLAKNCPVLEQDKRKTCAIDIFNVIASFAWGARYLARIALDCPEIDTVRERAACAAVVSDLVAIIAAFGPLVNGIADNCPYYEGRYSGVLPPGHAAFFGAVSSR